MQPGVHGQQGRSGPGSQKWLLTQPHALPLLSQAREATMVIWGRGLGVFPAEAAQFFSSTPASSLGLEIKVSFSARSPDLLSGELRRNRSPQVDAASVKGNTIRSRMNPSIDLEGGRGRQPVLCTDPRVSPALPPLLGTILEAASGRDT